MRVIEDIFRLERFVPGDTAVTIGVFDGIHIGHRNVIERLLEVKRNEDREASILLTFDRHPLGVVHPEAMPPLLTTLDEKLSLLESTGVDYVCVMRFSRETASIDYRSFVRDELIERLGMRHLVVGYDFHLGSGRAGSQELLQKEGSESGFGVTIVPPVVLGGRVVSSTKIRSAVLGRRLGVAARFLGRAYFFDAVVERGSGLGSGIGFPTANLSVSDSDKLVPPAAVYAVRVGLDGDCYDGMMNIGSAPTLHEGGKRRIEVHLFDFDGELYGRRLRIHCIRSLRREKRLAGTDELKAQLMHDREKVLRILEKE
jgi:riboflavin kinase/FMN adenylyltransferase